MGLPQRPGRVRGAAPRAAVTSGRDVERAIAPGSPRRRRAAAGPHRRGARALAGACLAAIAWAGGCDEAAAPGRIDIESPSPATGGGRLDEAIAIETSAGRLAPILERGCALPCTETVTFGTADDGQSEIALYVFRGDGPTTEGATALGAFEIVGFPLVSGEEVEVRVTFGADGGGVWVEPAPGERQEVVVRRIEGEDP